MTLAYKRNITIKDLVHITILLTDLTTSLKQKNMSQKNWESTFSLSVRRGSQLDP